MSAPVSAVLRLGILLSLGSLLWACQSGGVTPSQAQLQGVWQIQSIAGQAVPEDSRAQLEFSEPPRLTGNASCNRFFGVYEYRNGQLTIAPSIGASKMLCMPSVMARENQLLAALPDSTRVRLHQGLLELQDSDGNPIVQARRVQGESQ